MTHLAPVALGSATSGEVCVCACARVCFPFGHSWSSVSPVVEVIFNPEFIWDLSKLSQTFIQNLEM